MFLCIIHVEHVYYTCICNTCNYNCIPTCHTCVEYTPVLNTYFYTYNTYVGYTPVLHM